MLGSASRLFGGIPAGSGNFNGDVARIPDLSRRAANIQDIYLSLIIFLEFCVFTQFLDLSGRGANIQDVSPCQDLSPPHKTRNQMRVAIQSGCVTKILALQRWSNWSKLL